jgi:hypothetical protein
MPTERNPRHATRAKGAYWRLTARPLALPIVSNLDVLMVCQTSVYRAFRWCFRSGRGFSTRPVYPPACRWHPRSWKRMIAQPRNESGPQCASTDVQRHAGGIVHFICWTKRHERRHRRRVGKCFAETATACTLTRSRVVPLQVRRALSCRQAETSLRLSSCFPYPRLRECSAGYRLRESCRGACGERAARRHLPSEQSKQQSKKWREWSE